jgi:hypothetical protein
MLEQQEILVPGFPVDWTVSEKHEDSRGMSQQQCKLRFGRKRVIGSE